MDVCFSILNKIRCCMSTGPENCCLPTTSLGLSAIVLLRVTFLGAWPVPGVLQTWYLAFKGGEEEEDRTERIKERNKYTNITYIIQHRQVLTVDTGFIRGWDLCCMKVWTQETCREGDTKQQGRVDILIILVRRGGERMEMVVGVEVENCWVDHVCISSSLSL